MGHDVRGIAPGHNQLRTEIVTTYEQLLHAYAVRSICFMEEHGVPARHEFDGNDYQATHVIAYAGDEPIGTLRFAGSRILPSSNELLFAGPIATCAP